MPRLRNSPSIRPEVLPEYRIPFDRSKRYSFIFLTLQKFTPLRSRPGRSILRPVQPRKIRPSPNTIRRQIHHKRTHSVPAPTRRPGPVKVMPVVACRVVALRPHALDVEVRAPALESARAFLDAPHRVVAGEECAV